MQIENGSGTRAGFGDGYKNLDKNEDEIKKDDNENEIDGENAICQWVQKALRKPLK